jgi:hypothetical protein
VIWERYNYSSGKTKYDDEGYKSKLVKVRAVKSR